MNRKEIDDAAFWGGWICLVCGHATTEEERFEEGDSCPECEREGLVSAERVARFLDQIDFEETR